MTDWTINRLAYLNKEIEKVRRHYKQCEDMSDKKDLWERARLLSVERGMLEGVVERRKNDSI